ncbi:MAG TPA: hypothetical protein VGG44_08030 [Tepidisphaeraceae bacterium]|jgi:hypothetical protein
MRQFVNCFVIACGLPSYAYAFAVTNNHLIFSYTGNSPITTIAGYIASGYAGGTWTGPGIVSSCIAANPTYGVGYADGADVSIPTAHIAARLNSLMND